MRRPDSVVCPARAIAPVPGFLLALGWAAPAARAAAIPIAPGWNLVSIPEEPVDPDPAVLLAPSGTTSYTYDPLSRVATVTRADAGVTTFHYDAVGNRTRIEHANGVETRYTWKGASFSPRSRCGILCA